MKILLSAVTIIGISLALCSTPALSHDGEHSIDSKFSAMDRHIDNKFYEMTADLKSEIVSKLSDMDNKISDLDEKIDRMFSEIDSKLSDMDTKISELDEKTDRMLEDMGRQLDRIEARLGSCKQEKR